MLSGGATIGGVGDVTIADPLVFDTPNPGDSPFLAGSPIGGDATGITAPSSTEIFVALGSDIVVSPGVIDLLEIDFSGEGFLTLAPDLGETGGDVVAQGGGFDAIVNIAPLTIALGAPIPEPSSALLGAVGTAAAGVLGRRQRAAG